MSPSMKKVTSGSYSVGDNYLKKALERNDEKAKLLEAAITRYQESIRAFHSRYPSLTKGFEKHVDNITDDWDTGFHSTAMLGKVLRPNVAIVLATNNRGDLAVMKDLLTVLNNIRVVMQSLQGLFNLSTEKDALYHNVQLGLPNSKLPIGINNPRPCFSSNPELGCLELDLSASSDYIIPGSNPVAGANSPGGWKEGTEIDTMQIGDNVLLETGTRTDGKRVTKLVDRKSPSALDFVIEEPELERQSAAA